MRVQCPDRSRHHSAPCPGSSISPASLPTRTKNAPRAKPCKLSPTTSQVTFPWPSHCVAHRPRYLVVFLLREWIMQNARPGVFDEEPEMADVPVDAGAPVAVANDDIVVASSRRTSRRYACRRADRTRTRSARQPFTRAWSSTPTHPVPV